MGKIDLIQLIAGHENGAEGGPAAPPMAAGERSWRGFSAVFALAALAVALASLAFVLILDPYGTRVRPGEPARPLMDINQRFMYPQLARSGAFDAAVLGTSTMRLIDPAALSAGLGMRFVNLGMNAATPWEQFQMARFFASHTPRLRGLVWGLDVSWCTADATVPERRLTPRPFPPWLYDDVRWNDWAGQFNFTTLEIAARLLGHYLGRIPERIRGDGYEVFTPPEASYDLARARMHLFARTGGQAPPTDPLVPPEPVSAAVRAGWRFPALAWVDAVLADLPHDARKLLVLPPVHAASQARPGSAADQNLQACLSELAALARRRGAALIDYRFPSPLTLPDGNYWDPLHYRQAVARRLEGDLVSFGRGLAPARDGAFRILADGR